MNERERVEFCIALSNRIAELEGFSVRQRIEMGIRLKDHDCLMCALYGGKIQDCPTCPVDSFCAFLHARPRGDYEARAIFEETFENLCSEMNED